MATDLHTDLNAFNHFVRNRLDDDKLSLEESLNRFRQYQQELADLRGKLRVAEEQSAQGQSGPLNIEQTISRVRDRLAKEGMSD